MNRMASLAITAAAITMGAILVGCATDAPTKATGATGATIVPKAFPKPSAPAWTTNETEIYWAAVAKNATRITTAPRTTSGVDSEKGEGLLEAFGTRYMPNAYDNYEKVRDKAKECEQVFGETFPKGRASDTTGGKLYLKIGAATAKAVAEYFRRRDELCHFYLMHKAGIMTDAELATLDEAPICIMLPKELTSFLYFERDSKNEQPREPDVKELDFARKYRPETFAAYERQKALFGEVSRNYEEVFADAKTLDAIRGEKALSRLSSYRYRLQNNLNSIAKMLKEEMLLHSVGEKTADQLAHADAKFGVEARSFEKCSLSDYGDERLLGRTRIEDEWKKMLMEIDPVAALPLTMVYIPEKDFSICQFEVTLALWKAITGDDETDYRKVKGPLYPKSGMTTWYLNQFLGELNKILGTSGRPYRLPTKDEWLLACRAGGPEAFEQIREGSSKGSYKLPGRMENVLKREFQKDVHHDGGGKPVGEMDANAWDLYDMLGSVAEITSTTKASSDHDDDEIAMFPMVSHKGECYLATPPAHILLRGCGVRLAR